MKSSASPIISVCIPVFETEPYLVQCLRSVISQNFDSFEIVVVSDASRGKDEKGRSAKKIMKFAQKEAHRFRKKNKFSQIPVRFIEHRENRGILEVRRTLVYEARGTYIAMIDSDDEYLEGALAVLYESAIKNDADIVHGSSVAGTFDSEGKFIPEKENRYGQIFYGELTGRDVFRGWLLDGKLTANTWGKLIKREFWLKAYEGIPYTECNMADDVLLFFFLSQYASSYKGVENKVYRYRVNSGMTSARKIDSIHKWKMICSAASVFAVISEWIHSNPQRLKEDEINKIKMMTSYYLSNNLRQLGETVLPELQSAAREMLCEYWGKSFVERMENIVHGG